MKAIKQRDALFVLSILLFTGLFSASVYGRTFKIVPGEGGAYPQNVPQDTYLIMPGDEIEMEVFEKEYSQPISGTEKECHVKLKTAGMLVEDKYDNLPPDKQPRLTASGAVNETAEQTDMAIHATTQVYLKEGYTKFSNETEYALYLTAAGDYKEINGYIYDEQGAMIAQSEIKVIKYRGIWYPAKWAAEWDNDHYEDVQALYQGKTRPNDQYPTVNGGNDGYRFTVNNPVSKGRHFTCWTTDAANCGFENPVENRITDENGMSRQVIVFTPGRYAPTQNAEVVEKIVFIPNWEEGYTITYDPGKGKINGREEWVYEAVYENGSFTHPGLAVKPVLEGQEFDGWYYKDSEGKEKPFVNLNETPIEGWNGYVTNAKAEDLNLTVYAAWKNKQGVTDAGQKSDNPISVKGKTAKVKYSKLKKKNQTLALSKILSLKNEQGTLSYKIVKADKAKKYFKIQEKTGKLTIKKKLKKGTYKLQIKVTAAGNEKYKSAEKTVTVKVKVK